MFKASHFIYRPLRRGMFTAITVHLPFDPALVDDDNEQDVSESGIWTPLAGFGFTLEH